MQWHVSTSRRWHNQTIWTSRWTIHDSVRHVQRTSWMTWNDMKWPVRTSPWTTFYSPTWWKSCLTWSKWCEIMKNDVTNHENRVRQRENHWKSCPGCHFWSKMIIFRPPIPRGLMWDYFFHSGGTPRRCQNHWKSCPGCHFWSLLIDFDVISDHFWSILMSQMMFL